MRYLHTMIRIADIDKSLDFYCNKLGMREMRRMESEQGRFTLIFLAAPADRRRAADETAPLLELTYNWDPETYSGGRNFGHLAFEVDDMDPMDHHGWSVVVTGIAREITDPDELARIVPDTIPRFAPQGDGRVVAVSMDMVTGRRLTPGLHLPEEG